MTNHVTGIVLKIIAVTIFTVMMAIIKETSAHVPTGQQVFFRAFFTLLVIIGWLWARGDFPHGLKTQRIWGHMGRGFAGAAAMTLRFFALGVLSFPEVTALGFTTPLILTILAALLLGETVRLFRISTVALGFVGVLIVLWPNINWDGSRTTMETIGALAMIGSAALAALAQIFVRKLVSTEGTAQIVFYLSLLITVLSLFTIPFGWVMPPPYAFWLLVTAGVIGGLGQICLTASYKFAPASVVAPFDYTSMLLALAIAWLWFAEVPTALMLVGMTIIMASGAVIIWRENQLGKTQNREKQSQL